MNINYIQNGQFFIFEGDCRSYLDVAKTLFFKRDKSTLSYFFDRRIRNVPLDVNISPSSRLKRIKVK